MTWCILAFRCGTLFLIRNEVVLNYNKYIKLFAMWTFHVGIEVVKDLLKLYKNLIDVLLF